MKYVGLYAGGFKPFTSGHGYVLDLAASENDIVYVFVSQKDRARPKEFPIFWKDMKKVWEMIIKPSLPKNVKVVYVDEPTTAQFDILLSEEEQLNREYDPEEEPTIYTIYADTEDIKRYDNPRIKEKTLKTLFANGQVNFKPISRTIDSIDVSGTKARQALQNNDMESFVSMLPKSIQPLGFKVFQLLTKKKG